MKDYGLFKKIMEERYYGWLMDIIWKFLSLWLFSKFGIFGRIIIGIIILNRLLKGVFTLFRFMDLFMG